MNDPVVFEGAIDDPRVEDGMRLSAFDVPTLILDSDDQDRIGMSVCNLSPDLIDVVRRITAMDGAHSWFRVSVIQEEPSTDEPLPDVFGLYQVLEDRVRFIPHFPFDPGVAYRATFDPRPWDRSEITDVLTVDFSLPEAPGEPPTVAHVFPSSNSLPENVLRFYVTFSNPMQRGRCEAQIEVLRSDGTPALDVLYRAPVELWDRSMQCLTILLDPGRLKRGVGPNRALGPPLRVGEEYTLVVGSGMSDASGRPLGQNFCKRFRVEAAVREHVAVQSWEIVTPPTGGCAPIVLQFPSPLDWALLSSAIRVTAGREVMEGRIAIDSDERQWRFTPASPWSAGTYEVLVSTDLEDVSGNDLMGAFERPVGSNETPAASRPSSSLVFHLA